MKSAYFTDDTIDALSREMLRKLDRDMKVHRQKLTLERSALIVLDMQKYFLHPESHAFIPSAAPIIQRISDLARAYHEMELPVILTRHLNTVRDAKLMSSWWDDIITEDDGLSEIVPELYSPDYTFIGKTQYDAFYGTSLDRILRERGAEQVVITGVMTHLCCETTARSAFVRGYSVFFPVDGTATYTEDFHRAALLNLSHGFAVPILMNDVYSLIKNQVDG